MKINWFSPLPPARSGVTAQTLAILPRLSKRAEVTVWSSDETATPQAQANFALKYFDPTRPPWREISQADITFYQLGNDPRHHHAIWRISRQHPGVVILHDLKLQHFFSGLVQTQGLSRRDYLELLERYHGLAGRVAGEAFLRGELSRQALAERYPMTAAATENALAAVVHWEGAWPDHPDALPVIALPLAVEASGRPTLARNERSPNETYRLIIFGLLGANRRLPAFLAALAQFPGRARFQLDVYGTIEGDEKMEELLARLGLTSVVKLHGFVADAELEAAISASDLAINLRYPTMGEVSASQLHLWHEAVPTLVTQDGWYASAPAETVAFVRPEEEAADIQKHLRAFLEKPAGYQAIGENGQRHVRAQHTMENYVEGLLSIAENVGDFQANWIAHQLAARAGASIAAWSGAFEDDDLLQGVAQQIRTLAAPIR
ncbi:MAG: glycosyltransferase family protein [Chthoniobacterales bacterium]